MFGFLYADDLHKDLATVSDTICEEINSWAVRYKELLSNEEHATIDAKFLEKHPNICCNKIAQLVYMFNSWGSFIAKQFSSFLQFEVYSLIHQHNTSNNMRIAMHKRSRKIQLGSMLSQPIKITDFFYFVNLKPNEHQSIYDVREVVESTMFDLFEVYLKQAIDKAISFEQAIKNFIQNNPCKIDDTTLNIALEHLDEFEKLIFRVSGGKSISPEKFKFQFNKQLDWIENNLIPGDILHITFSVASGESIQDNKNKLLFPLQISDLGAYNWLDNCKLLGAIDSNYFGIHIDSMFINERFFYSFLVNNGLYKLANQGKVDYYEQLQVYTNPIFAKRNMFLFNAGDINLNLRCYAKNINKYYLDYQPVDISIDRLEKLLQKGINLVLGSHRSYNDEINNIVGPFLLVELLELQEKYHNLNIVFHNRCGVPYIYKDPRLCAQQQLVSSEKNSISPGDDFSLKSQQEMLILSDFNNNSFNSHNSYEFHAQQGDELQPPDLSFSMANLSFADNKDVLESDNSSLRCLIF